MAEKTKAELKQEVNELNDLLSSRQMELHDWQDKTRKLEAKCPVLERQIKQLKDKLARVKDHADEGWDLADEHRERANRFQDQYLASEKRANKWAVVGALAVALIARYVDAKDDMATKQGECDAESDEGDAARRSENPEG